MGTAIKHPVSDRVKPSLVIFDTRGRRRVKFYSRSSEVADAARLSVNSWWRASPVLICRNSASGCPVVELVPLATSPRSDETGVDAPLPADNDDTPGRHSDLFPAADGWVCTESMRSRGDTNFTQGGCCRYTLLFHRRPPPPLAGARENLEQICDGLPCTL